jgi:hypothetical protein
MKIGVVLRGPVVPRWQADCIGALTALDAVDVAVAFAREGAREPGWTAKLIGGATLEPVAIEPIGDLVGSDVVLDLTGDAGDRGAREGTWSLRLGTGDDEEPFVRDVARGARTFDVVLLRRSRGQTEELRRGRFPVTYWHRSTVRGALAEAARWPALFVAALRDGRPLPAVVAASPPPARRANALDRLRFAFVMASRLAAFLFAELFEITEWNVGLAAGEPSRALAVEPLEVRWLPRPPRETYIADPFVVDRDGRRLLFVEAFSYARDRGTIEALELDARGAPVARECVLDLPTHVSYPYPVVYGGALYLVPENVAANDVALYRSAAFGGGCERAASIFPGFDGVDTTLFEHDGRWWAFCTRLSRGSLFALFAFHAATPFGPWTEHALNPIVVDISCARPGGTPFVVDGALYRPGQDCSVSYGGGLAIARVDELTPTSYRETIVRRLDPRGFGRYADGVHTLSVAAGTLFVDGKHVYYDVRKLSRSLRGIGARIASRLARRTRTAPA